jgi:hypothetical protein
MVRRRPAPALPVPGFELSESGGTIFYGTDGIMAVTSHSGSVWLLPEVRMQELRASLPAKTIPRVSGGPLRSNSAPPRRHRFWCSISNRPRIADGGLAMFTRALDLDALLPAAADGPR